MELDARAKEINTEDINALFRHASECAVQYRENIAEEFNKETPDISKITENIGRMDWTFNLIQQIDGILLSKE